MKSGKQQGPEIILIAATSLNGVIGQPSFLRWKILEKSPNFRSLVPGHPVIMGRKTWEMLDPMIIGSRNIVITGSRDYFTPHAQVVHSIADALALVADEKKVFVIGGAQLFSKMFKLADRLCITEVNAVISGNHHFPDIRPKDWVEVKRSMRQSAILDLMSYCFVEYVRKKDAQSTVEKNRRSLNA